MFALSTTANPISWDLSESAALHFMLACEAWPCQKVFHP